MDNKMSLMKCVSSSEGNIRSRIEILEDTFELIIPSKRWEDEGPEGWYF